MAGSYILACIWPEICQNSLAHTPEWSWSLHDLRSSVFHNGILTILVSVKRFLLLLSILEWGAFHLFLIVTFKSLTNNYTNLIPQSLLVYLLSNSFQGLG